MRRGGVKGVLIERELKGLSPDCNAKLKSVGPLDVGLERG